MEAPPQSSCLVHALPLQVTSFNPSPHDSSSPSSPTNSSRGAVGPCNCTTKSFPNAPIKELWALLMAYRPLVILWPSTAPQPFTRQHNLQVIPRMMSQELNIIYVGKWTIISAYEFINVCIVIGNYARQHIRGDRKDNPLIFGKLCWHRGCGDHVAILIIGKGQLRIEYLLNRSIDKNSMTTIVSMKWAIVIQDHRLSSHNDLHWVILYTRDHYELCCENINAQFDCLFWADGILQSCESSGSECVSIDAKRSLRRISRVIGFEGRWRHMVAACADCWVSEGEEEEVEESVSGSDPEMCAHSSGG